MRYLFIGGLLSCALVSLQACAAPLPTGWAPHADISLWAASDAIPLNGLDGDWAARVVPRQGRNVALMRNRAEIGVRMNQWQLGYEVRQDASLVADERTLDLLRMRHLGQNPAAPVTLPVSARYANWSARGLRAGRTFEGPRVDGQALRLDVSLVYYTQPRYRMEEATGSFSYLQGGAYAVDASTVDRNSDATFLYMHGKVSGSGPSASVALDVPLPESLSLKLKIDDLWSRIRWQRLPVVRQSIHSDRSVVDSNGFINYTPMLTGSNQQIDQSTSIGRYGAATLERQAGAWHYALQVERFAQVTIPTLALAREFGWGRLTGRIDTRFHTVGLGFERAKLYLLLQADSLHMDRAKALMLQLAYLHPF